MPKPDPPLNANNSSAPPRASNVVNVGENAQVGQLAVGANITQIKGFTADQVNVLLTRIQTEYRPKPFDGRSPYVGLAAFQERDAAKFFGRETLIADLVARATASAATNARAVFVAGPSGSGKSSLVRAGLIPALRGGVQLNALTLVATERWLYETMKPGREPLAELKRVVASFANSPDAGANFFAHTLDDAARLHEWVDIALGDDTARRALIVIDQFEEIFTQLPPERETERAAFLNLLTHATTAENGRALVVFTLRSDFVTNCASYPALNALVSRQFLQVGAMTPDELVSAIARPALQVGLRLDPALIAQIVNDVRGEPGALPLMQFALRDLFDAEKEKGELTLDGYIARGGLHEALERHADAEFAKLDETEKQLARSVFGGLVEIGRGREDTKRTAIFEDLVPADANSARVQALVRELADARLITTDQQGDKEIVTLAHERLITAWKWLQNLVNENREAIALQNEIAEDAGEWAKAGRDASYLYRGARLATAQEKLQGKQLVLSGLAQEFIDTALQAREHEHAEREAARQRELEQARALAEEQQRRAEAQDRARQEAEQRAQAQEQARLEAEKRTQAEEQSRIAAEQREQAQTEARREAEKSTAAEKQRGRILRIAAIGLSVLLLAAIAASYFAFQQRNIAIKQQSIAESKENERATAAADANAQAAAARTEQAKAEQQALISQSKSLAAQSLNMHDENFALSYLLGIEAFRTNPTYEAFSNLLNFRFDSSIPTRFLWAHEQRASSVAFSPDGKALATGGLDNTIVLWDIATYQRIGELSGNPDQRLVDLAFAPDGKTLASTVVERGSNQRSIVLWDLKTQTQKDELKMDGYAIWLSHNFETVAAQNSEESILFGFLNREETVTLKSAGSFRVMSDDGKTLATQTEDAIILWDIVNQQKLGEIKIKPTVIEPIAFSHDGKTIAVTTIGAKDEEIILWDVVGQQAIGTLVGHEGQIHSLAFSPNTTILVSSSAAERRARIWDIAKQKQITELEGDTYMADILVFSPDGRTLVAGDCVEYNGNGESCLAGQIILWDMASKLSNSLSTKLQIKQLGENLGPVQSIAYSPDGKILAASRCASPCKTPDTILLWDMVRQRQMGSLRGDFDQVVTLAFSPDSNTLVTSGTNETIYLWDLKTQTKISELKNAGSVFALGPDGTLLASKSIKSKDIILWDFVKQRQIGQIGTVEGTLDEGCFKFSPDGKTFVVSFDQSTLLLDVINKKMLGKITQEAWNCSFSPDGKYLFVSGGGLFDVTKLHEVGRFKDKGYAEQIALSPDGKTLVLGSTESPGIHLWDVTNRLLIGEVARDESAYSMTYSPDGKNLAMGGWDRILLFDFDTQVWLQMACKIVNRNFTRAEYAQYISREPGTYDTEYAKNPTCPDLPVEPLSTPTPTP